LTQRKTFYEEGFPMFSCTKKIRSTENAIKFCLIFFGLFYPLFSVETQKYEEKFRIET
jgi:hypothetical protein